MDWAQTTTVLRTPWDYVPRFAEFNAWLAQLEAGGGRVVNPLGTLRWNLHKRYLLELESAGIKTIPTRLLPQGSKTRLAELRTETGWGELVVKPAVSAGALGTYRAPPEVELEEQFAASLADGDTLVQPFLSEVLGGELSLVFFAGSYSHAVLKVPSKGDYRVQSDYGGSVLPLRAVAAPVREAAAAALAAAPPSTYARVDGVVVRGEFLLMEVELIEPELFLDRAPESSARFAAALRALSG